MPLLNLLEKAIDVGFAILPRPKPSKKAAAHGRLIAHRGAHSHKDHIIENTLAAFYNAQKLNCWGVELDIRACQDGSLVIHHDPTLKRLWQCDEHISQCSLQAIKKLAPCIPTLDEVIARFGKKLHLFIELKKPFTQEQALFTALKDLNPMDDYHLLSLDPELFAKLTLFPRESLLLVPLQNNVRQFCKISKEEGYGGVLGHYLLLTDALVQALREEKQIAGVGFINSKYSLYRELNRGISYLFTDAAKNVSDELNKLKS